MGISELIRMQTLTLPIPLNVFELPEPAEVAHSSLLRIGSPSLLKTDVNPLPKHTTYAHLRIYPSSSPGY